MVGVDSTLNSFRLQPLKLTPVLFPAWQKNSPPRLMQSVLDFPGTFVGFWPCLGTDKRFPLLPTPPTPSQRCCYFAWRTPLSPPQPEQPKRNDSKHQTSGPLNLMAVTTQSPMKAARCPIGSKSGRNRVEIGSKSGRNRVEIGSKSGRKPGPFAASGRNRVPKPGPRKTRFRGRVEIGSKSGRNRIDIGSKSDRNRVGT